jgi:hypothetical protein
MNLILFELKWYGKMSLKYTLYVSIGTVYSNCYKNTSVSSLNLRVDFEMNVHLDSAHQKFIDIIQSTNLSNTY